MNFKPFYIKNLTKEQQAKVIDKSIEAGATLYEGVAGYHDHLECYLESNHLTHVGVTSSGVTLLTNFTFHNPAIEITLDQLDEHLGVSPKTPDNKCTELRKVKIDLRKEDGTVDEELSEAFQRAVFASGGKWLDGSKEPNWLPSGFLYVDKVGVITHSMSPKTYEFFKRRENKQISFKSITTWEAEYVPEPKEEETKRNIVSLPDGTKVYQDELEALISSSKNLTIIEEE